MATALSEQDMFKIVKDRTLKLERKAGDDPNYRPSYRGIVVMEDKILVTDWRARNLQINNRLDGKPLSAPHGLEDLPTDVCILSSTEVAVCLSGRKIVILSLESIHDVKPVKTFDVSTGICECYSVVKWRSDKLLVSGQRNAMLSAGMSCWSVLSLEDGSLDSTHNICEVKGWTHVTVKDNTLYVSCRTGDSITRGVYAFDVLNPRHEPKFLYQHQELKNPGSIMADRDYVYVSGRYPNTIHQVTHNGQLVIIHRMSSDIYEMFYDDQHRLLYTTCGTNEITVYKIEYPHQAGIPIEILNMDKRSIQLFENALKGGKETIYSLRVMVIGYMGVGKTTLVKRLLGKEVMISDRHSTEGIDVHVNCCDVLVSTSEWSSREKDSEQDQLQRLVKIVNENYQISGTTADQKQDASYPQTRKTDQNPSHTQPVGKKTDQNPIDFDADDDKNLEILYQQNLPSTASHQKESPSTGVQRSHTQPVGKMVPGREYGKSHAIQSQKMDPLRQMIKLLNKKKYKAKQDVKEIARVSIWDFAGQYAFYTTHQMFLTTRAIYLLVADVSGHIKDDVKDECSIDIKGREKCNAQELVEIWLNSIHSCAPSDQDIMNSANSSTSSNTVIPPPVILVGTHVDKIPQIIRHERGQEYLKDIRSYLGDKPVVFHLVDEDFALDNSIVDSRLEDLKRKIIDVASQQPYWGEQIPTTWFLLEYQLMCLRDAGMKVIPRSLVEQIKMEGNVQVKDDELDLFLNYLHVTGTVIYFSIEILRENIILDPEWLIYALKSLINAHDNLPESPADSGSQSGSTTDNGSHPHRHTDSNADNSSHPNTTTDSAVTEKWSDFQKKGILSLELVDAIWTENKHPDLHAHKDHALKIMEQFNIIAKPRSFSDNGIEKVDNSYLVPCMLRQESSREVISLEQDPHMVSTSVLCCVFSGMYLPPPIFHRLIAACITRWPVSKDKMTKENLIFCGCCVFDIDPLHRLTLHVRNHIIFAKISRMEIDDVKSLDRRLCSRVRRFLTLNLSKITAYLGPNLQYEMSTLCPPPSQYVSENSKLSLSPPFSVWFVDEGHDPDSPINVEHMYHARLCVALVTVCGKAMREVLRTKFDPKYKDIYDAILSNRAKLTTKTGGKSVLDNYQIQLVFPQGQTTGTLEHFDISLLYKLIRNISSVKAPSIGWGKVIQDTPPRDTSLGASMERIRSYRNSISGHSTDAKINKQDFQDYWKKFETVLHDIEAEIGGQAYSQELEKQRKQVISIYEAC